MSEVQVRISQLREAAGQLQTSSQRIEQSVQSASDVIDSMLVLGSDNPDFQRRYLQFRGQMFTWAETLTRFSEQLTHAADDIELARQGNVDLALFGRRFGHPAPAPPTALTAAVIGTTLAARVTLDSYMSRMNQPLYDYLKVREAQLNEQQVALATLIDTRNAKATDFEALKNRLYSYDPNTDVNSIPRVQALQVELDRLDVQIADMQQQVDVLQMDVDQIKTRLERVAPAASANLETIMNLEGTSSPAWMNNSTFDCVRHVIGKFHVPNGIAVDAHLWDDMAASLPEYGITAGNVPLEGSVLMMEPSHPYADDVFGHVMYVERVEGGEVWITDNLHPDTPVKLSSITTVTSSENMKYLYFPWNTKA